LLGKIGIIIKTKDWWSVFWWHCINVFKKSGMLQNIWNMIIEVRDILIEAVVWHEE